MHEEEGKLLWTSMKQKKCYEKESIIRGTMKHGVYYTVF